MENFLNLHLASIIVNNCLKQESSMDTQKHEEKQYLYGLKVSPPQNTN